MKTIQCAYPPHYHNGFVATLKIKELIEIRKKQINKQSKQINKQTSKQNNCPYTHS